MQVENSTVGIQHMHAQRLPGGCLHIFAGQPALISRLMKTTNKMKKTGKFRETYLSFSEK